MTPKKTLQIAVNSIPEVGKDLTPDLGKEWFARWHQEDPSLEFSEAAITGTVQLARHGRDILVRGHLAGQLGLTCGRCLEGFAAPMAADFDLLLAPGPNPRARQRKNCPPRNWTGISTPGRWWTWKASSGNRSS